MHISNVKGHIANLYLHNCRSTNLTVKSGMFPCNLTNVFNNKKNREISKHCVNSMFAKKNIIL